MAPNTNHIPILHAVWGDEQLGAFTDLHPSSQWGVHFNIKCTRHRTFLLIFRKWRTYSVAPQTSYHLTITIWFNMWYFCFGVQKLGRLAVNRLFGAEIQAGVMKEVKLSFQGPRWVQQGAPLCAKTTFINDANLTFNCTKLILHTLCAKTPFFPFASAYWEACPRTWHKD